MSETTIQNDRAIQVIVACSEAGERQEMCELLGKNRRLLVRAAADWDELRSYLNSDICDVVVLTAEVDGLSGFEINQRLRTFVRDPPATVMVDALGTAHSVIKAFRCGFADYVPKDWRRDTDLRDAVMHAAATVSTAREQAQHIRDLERMAQRDSVTGLANRYYLRERLNQSIEIGRRHGVPFAATLIRVNDLDRIRSVFGSKVADAVLMAFAKRLQAASRKSSTFGRLNDDTFLYLLEQEATEESLAGACARLTAALTFSLDLDDVSLSVSANVAAGAFPRDGTTIPQLLNAAERGLQVTLASTADSLPSEADHAAGSMPAAGPDAAIATATFVVQDTPASMRIEPGALSTAREDGDLRVMEPASREAAALTEMPVSANAAIEAILTTRINNRRNAVRHRCLKRGMLVFNNGFSTVNCLVRDLSDTGARIEVDGSFDMLQAFELRLLESGQRFRVEKRWQTGNKYGLRFIV
jgi:diguanylate cyclase (GGDEF)-like protein